MLEHIDKVEEILRDCKELKDKEAAKAIDEVLMLIANPEAAHRNAATMMVRLQAIASRCALLARHYTTFDTGKTGSEQAKKKNFYYTLSDELEKIVAVLKIVARQ